MIEVLIDYPEERTQLKEMFQKFTNNAAFQKSVEFVQRELSTAKPKSKSKPKAQAKSSAAKTAAKPIAAKKTSKKAKKTSVRKRRLNG